MVPFTISVSRYVFQVTRFVRGQKTPKQASKIFSHDLRSTISSGFSYSMLKSQKPFVMICNVTQLIPQIKDASHPPKPNLVSPMVHLTHSLLGGGQETGCRCQGGSMWFPAEEDTGCSREETNRKIIPYSTRLSRCLVGTANSWTHQS